jgi:hypothetical protein
MPHVSEPHAQHDPLLVASLAAGDLAGTDRDRASALIADCADCASLHSDLLAIARATAALPPVRAPRDFTLSPEQAAALRPVGWRRLVAAIGGSRPLMSRQLGIGLATIGLAGLLVSTLPGIQLGSTASAPMAAPAGSASRGDSTVTELSPESGGAVGIAGDAGSPVPPRSVGGPVSAAASAAASEAAQLAPAPTRSIADGVGVYGAASSAGGTAETADGRNSTVAGPSARAGPDGAGTSDQLGSGESPTASDGGRGLVAGGSVILLAAGIALLVIRRLVRRQHWS